MLFWLIVYIIDLNALFRLNKGSVRYLVNIMRASGEFEISEGGTVVASGTIRPAEENEKIVDLGPLTSPTDMLNYDLDAEDIYKELRLRGYEYHGLFMGILKADIRSKYCYVSSHY